MFSNNDSTAPSTSTRKTWALAALVLLALAALITAGGLYDSAGYALAGNEPDDVGELRTANLHDAGAWVTGTMAVRGQALAFKRRGQHGSFRLGRSTERNDLWVMVAVPDGIDNYVPPARFSGRLLQLGEASMGMSPIVSMVESEGGTDKSYLLIDGMTPQTERSSLFAFVALILVGLSALAFSILLTRPVASNLPLGGDDDGGEDENLGDDENVDEDEDRNVGEDGNAGPTDAEAR